MGQTGHPGPREDLGCVSAAGRSRWHLGPPGMRDVKALWDAVPVGPRDPAPPRPRALLPGLVTSSPLQKPPLPLVQGAGTALSAVINICKSSRALKGLAALHCEPCTEGYPRQGAAPPASLELAPRTPPNSRPSQRDGEHRQENTTKPSETWGNVFIAKAFMSQNTGGQTKHAETARKQETKPSRRLPKPSNERERQT